MHFCFFEKFFWLIFDKFLHYFWIDLYINFWIVFGSISGSFSAQFLSHFWFHFETLFGSDFGLICGKFLGQIGVVFNMCYIQIILCSHEELNVSCTNSITNHSNYSMFAWRAKRFLYKFNYESFELFYVRMKS